MTLDQRKNLDQFLSRWLSIDQLLLMVKFFVVNKLGTALNLKIEPLEQMGIYRGHTEGVDRVRMFRIYNMLR